MPCWHSMGVSSCWHWWSSCWGFVGSSQCQQHCHCPQGLAGPPGPSGPALVLSQEELQVSDPSPAGKELPVLLSHVLLLLRSPVHQDQEDPATPSLPTLVLVPCTSHPLPQHLVRLLVGRSVISSVISPPFSFSTSFILPTS